MAGNVVTSIRGIKEMETLLQALGVQVARRVGTSALRAGAKPIVEDAKRRVPVDSGALRDSITISTGDRHLKAGVGDDQVAIFIGFEKPTSARAHLTEFGTRHAPAQPFMRPAMDANHQAALDEMAKVLKRGIEREAQKLAKPLR
jgi:HK97 gp10 family phage protein